MTIEKLLKSNSLNILLTGILSTSFLQCSNPMNYEDHQNQDWKINKSDVERIYRLMEYEAEELNRIIGRPNKYGVSINEKNITELTDEEIKDIKIENIRSLQNRFKYISGRNKDWSADIETVFYNGIGGECDEAALLGKWSLEQIGIASRFLRLYSIARPDTVHLVTMSKDNDILIDLYYVALIKSKDWQDAVFTFPFRDRKYDWFMDLGDKKEYWRKDYCKD